MTLPSTIADADEARAPADADPLASLPRLGVGILFNPALPDFLRSRLDAVDYVEVIPDMGQIDRGPGHLPRYEELEFWTSFLDWLVQYRPVVAHNIGLSIGSADLFDPDYVGQIERWRRRYRFAWHSDHLSYGQVLHSAEEVRNVGLALPVPYDDDVLDMIAGRIDYVQQAVPRRFLIENNVYFFDIPEQDMSEPAFLNRLAQRTGCGLLLDLHNLYANARNHRFDALTFLEALDLSRVVEIHIAGGNELGDMYVDSHSGPCPEPVWELLEHVVPRAPRLCGITFEFHESYYEQLGVDGIRKELDRAREVWTRHR